MNKERTVNINNFIGVYDNYITEEECNRAISIYEQQDRFNNTVNRIGSEKSDIIYKQDQQLFVGAGNIEVWWEELKSLIYNFNTAWNHLIVTGKLYY